MVKTKDFSTPEGIRQWRALCGFVNDADACQALGVPFRTYSRWKRAGLPHVGITHKLAAEAILARMDAVLRDIKAKK